MTVVLEREAAMAEGSEPQSDDLLTKSNLGGHMINDRKYELLVQRIAYKHWESLGCPMGRPNAEQQDRAAAEHLLFWYLDENQLSLADIEKSASGVIDSWCNQHTPQ